MSVRRGSLRAPTHNDDNETIEPITEDIIHGFERIIFYWRVVLVKNKKITFVYDEI